MKNRVTKNRRTRSEPTGSLLVAKRTGEQGVKFAVCWLVARMLARLGFMGGAAIVVGSTIMDEPVGWGMSTVTVGFLCLSVVVGCLGDRHIAASESVVAGALRRDAQSKLQDIGARRIQSIDVGSLLVGMQRYPDAVAALTIGHRAASLMMAIGPLLAAAALAVVSWQACLALLALTPVMIVFFALVGGLIRQLATAQEVAFGNLAGQFADRVRTLPTVLANDALAGEEAKLRARLETYAERTMAVLRIAFMNAAIIDFFASLSIAMLAIFLGLGHLRLVEIPGFSRLELWQSLFILMIAPDYFAPFRRFAEQYHAKAEGQAAAEALDGLLDPATLEAPVVTQAETLHPSLPLTGLVAISGPSGAGKTTLLREIVGVDREGGGWPTAPVVCWIGMDSPLPGRSLGEAIVWNAGTVSMETAAAAAARVGLTADAMLPAGLDYELQSGGGNLSGGQRLRVSIARALLVDRMVVADEPTAKLDAATASLVRAVLQDMAKTRLVLVATHDAEIIQSAERNIVLGGMCKQESAA